VWILNPWSVVGGGGEGEGAETFTLGTDADADSDTTRTSSSSSAFVSGLADGAEEPHGQYSAIVPLSPCVGAGACTPTTPDGAWTADIPGGDVLAANAALASSNGFGAGAGAALTPRVPSYSNPGTLGYAVVAGNPPTISPNPNPNPAPSETSVGGLGGPSSSSSLEADAGRSGEGAAIF
jgi:hypothetical protein